jgi:hypothetical protein
MLDASFGDLHFLTGEFVTKRQVIGAKRSYPQITQITQI